jgi:hypothetical protein
MSVCALCDEMPQAGWPTEENFRTVRFGHNSRNHWLRHRPLNLAADFPEDRMPFTPSLGRSRVLTAATAIAIIGAGASSTAVASRGVRTHAPAAPTSNHCAKSAIRVPSCGVLWGLFEQRSRPSGARYVKLERSTGRRFDLVKSYVDWHSHGVFPAGPDRRLARHGRTLYYSWNAVNFGTHRGVTYSSIIHGDWDRSVILPEARHLKHFHHKIFLDFGHEFDGYRHRGNGSIAEFRAAYRHIHDLMTLAGVHNVIWSWVSTGFLGNQSAIKAGFPGKKYVDWIGYDPYNLDGCVGRPWRTPMQLFAPFYRWTSHQRGMRHKPLLLSEYGSVLGKQVYRWYAAIPAVVKRLPRLKAFMQFSAPTSSGCDTTLSDSRDALAGFTKAGSSPAVTGAGG